MSSLRRWCRRQPHAQPLGVNCSLKSYVPDMDAAAAKLVTEVEAAAAGGGAFDVKKTLERMTMQVIGSTAFGCADERFPG